MTTTTGLFHCTFSVKYDSATTAGNNVFQIRILQELLLSDAIVNVTKRRKNGKRRDVKEIAQVFI